MRRLYQHIRVRSEVFQGYYIYSVLKKYQQRLKRIEFQNKEYEPEWSKMEVKWEKNV